MNVPANPATRNLPAYGTDSSLPVLLSAGKRHGSENAEVLQAGRAGMAIYIGLGANLDHPRYGSPQRTLAAALGALAGVGVRPVRQSRWYRSSPMPPSGQPWYVNAVAEVLTGLGPDAMLASLHRIEDAFGRIRRERDEARVVDLDLLDYESCVKQNTSNGLAVLPHPRLEARAFVLLPLAELAPGWRHPVSGASIATLIARLPADQQIAPLSD